MATQWDEGSRWMNYRAVLFDLDGTLLDTIHDLAASMNHVLRDLGLPEHQLEAYKSFVGDGVEMLVRRALPFGHRDEETVHRGVGAMRDEYGRRWGERTRPYDGIPALLDALTARHVKMAILSNKPDDLTKTTVSALLSEWRFEPVLGERPFVPKKPDPAGALEISARLEIPPAEFLYVGDTNTDMQTANAACMFPVGALWGFRTAEELFGSGAKALIEKPLDLLGLL
jgi:phosphoglycolate phosphatase